MRRLTLLLAVGALLVGSAPATASSSACASSANWVETYEVELQPRADRYELGKRAVVDVVVTRVATGLPAPDVEVVMAILQHSGHAFGRGVTGSDGIATVKVRLLRKRFEPGWVEAKALAQRVHFPEGQPLCADATEYGYGRLYEAFKITR